MSVSKQQHQNAQAQNTNSHLALAAIGTSFLAVMGLTFPFVSMQLRSPLPYMATPRHKVEKALKFLLERRRTGTHDQFNNEINNKTSATVSPNHHMNNIQPRFVDLGSGDGTTIFAAASLSYKSTGIELNPTLFAISSIRRMFQPTEIRRNCSLIHGDMFKSIRLKNELNKADCVMVFGVNSLMPKIADLIEKECQRSTYVMSYRFRLPLLKQSGTDSNEIKSGIIGASLIYEEEEMRVYELRNGGFQSCNN